MNLDSDSLRAHLAHHSRGYPAALALVTRSELRLVTHACSADADFEIGSISKGFTGLLYCDARDRGEVSADTRLGTLLPLAGSPAAGIPLDALATHRSGLPGVLLPHVLRRTLAYHRHGTNPWVGNVDDLFAAARAARLRSRRPRYSNAGFQLLGLAVAAAAGCSYPDLLRTRLVEPLGLAPCYVPAGVGDVLTSAVAGHRKGRVVDPWPGEHLGPAGGIRASIGALAHFARALLDGRAPGMAALDPAANFAGRRVLIGAGWIVSERGERGSLTWHNGGTGGFRSWLGLRRDRGLAVAVASSVTVSVDRLGLTLLDAVAETDHPSPPARA